MAGKGRPFQKGNPGKPKGTKDKVPRGARKSIVEMYRNILARSGAKIELAAERRLLKGDPKALEQLAAYIDGKPAQEIRVRELQPITFEFPPETDRPALPP